MDPSRTEEITTPGGVPAPKRGVPAENDSHAQTAEDGNEQAADLSLQRPQEGCDSDEKCVVGGLDGIDDTGEVGG